MGLAWLLALPEKVLREGAKQLGLSFRTYLIIVAIIIIALLTFLYFMVKG